MNDLKQISEDKIRINITLPDMKSDAYPPKQKNEFSIVRLLRQTLGLTRKEFAERCGISAIYCYELESGKCSNPSPEIIEKISEVCGIKPKTIKFFLNEKEGIRRVYQKCLIKLLEQLEMSFDESVD